jgi:hypothetical protein
MCQGFELGPWLLAGCVAGCGAKRAGQVVVGVVITGSSATATEFTRLADPELVDEQVPVGVELVVADACGKDGQVARVVQRHPGGFVHECPVDGSPPAHRCGGSPKLEGVSVLGLGVDLRIAELRRVEVGRPGGKERTTAEQRADEVRCHRVG